MTSYLLFLLVVGSVACAIFLQVIGDRLRDIWLVMRRNEEVAKITREYQRTLDSRPQPPYGPPQSLYTDARGNLGRL